MKKKSKINKKTTKHQPKIKKCRSPFFLVINNEKFLSKFDVIKCPFLFYLSFLCIMYTTQKSRSDIVMTFSKLSLANIHLCLSIEVSYH